MSRISGNAFFLLLLGILISTGAVSGAEISAKFLKWKSSREDTVRELVMIAERIQKDAENCSVAHAAFSSSSGKINNVYWSSYIYKLFFLNNI